VHNTAVTNWKVHYKTRCSSCSAVRMICLCKSTKPTTAPWRSVICSGIHVYTYVYTHLCRHMHYTLTNIHRCRHRYRYRYRYRYIYRYLCTCLCIYICVCAKSTTRITARWRIAICSGKLSQTSAL